MIFEAFKRLKFNVIMKWDEDIEGLPENILIGKWLPQEKILAHQNVKLFISHCGMGGLVESKYHGVPVLAIPIFLDQYVNANELLREGRGMKLSFNEINEKTFFDAIMEVIENKT